MDYSRAPCLGVNQNNEIADPHAVQRYLGMLNFLARFCPKLGDVVKPLRELTHKGVTFQWTDSHDLC